MKKLFLILLTIFIPVVIYAETCNNDKITISSIDIENITDYVNEISQATAIDKSINFNLGMSGVGDSVRYRMVIQNDSEEDYELDKNSVSLSSGYVNYTFDSEDNSTVIKAGSSKVVYLKVSYDTQVPDEAYQGGVFNDNKVITVSLSTGNGIENPKTGVKSYTLILTLLIIVSGAAYLALSKKEYASLMVIIVGAFIIIPMSVNAICKCELTLNPTVKILKEPFTGTITRASSTVFKNGDFIDEQYITCPIENANCVYKDSNEFINNQVYYLKHDVVKNKIMKSYVCQNDNCFLAGPEANWEENKQLFFTMHPENTCTITDDVIKANGSHDEIRKNGNVTMGSYCGECAMNSNGETSCKDLDVVEC